MNKGLYEKRKVIFKLPSFLVQCISFRCNKVHLLFANKRCLSSSQNQNFFFSPKIKMARDLPTRRVPVRAAATTPMEDSAQPPLELTIDATPKPSFVLIVPREQMVDDLRAKVAAKLSYPTEETELRIGEGQVLSNGKDLDHYDLPDFCRIVAHRKVAGEVSVDDAIASLAELKGKCKGVDVCFAFDTTGSMSAVIREVRKQVRETCQRLMGDIQGIRISIMGVGDYCDQMSSYVVHTLDFSTQPKEIEDFVDRVGATFGGDAPECYEWALHKANRLSWRADPGVAKAFVLIADALPHPPSYSSAHCSWQDELGIMADRGVKVYAVQATTDKNVVPFYARLAERSGGLHLTFKSFDLITRMFLAVCYREAGRLGEYQAEGRRGARGAEMGEILDSMAKPNEKMAEKSKIVCHQPWFTETVAKAKGKRPIYFYDPTRDMFFSFSEEKYGKFLDKEKYSIGMEKAIDEQFQVRKWADLLTDVDRITQYTSGTCAPVWKTKAPPAKAASPKKTVASPRTPKKKAAPPKAKTPPASSSSGAAAARGGVKRKRVASDTTVDVSKRAKKDEMTEREERLQKRREKEEKGEGLKRTYYWHY